MRSKFGRQIAIAQIERLTGGLREVARDADQKIGMRVAGLRPIDIEGPVEGGVRVLITWSIWNCPPTFIVCAHRSVAR